ncbi:MAG: cation diffusion facilitator family transporter [Thiomonas sp.]
MHTDLTDDTESEYSAEERAAAASRSTWVSVAVNLGLSTLQILVGMLAKSQALMADGVHSLSDLLADFIVLLASHFGKKDADAEHPYGHHRFETAASLALGALLFAVGIGMLWSAFLKLEHPHSVPQVHSAALWVAATALVAKELLFRYMLGVANRGADEDEVEAIRQTLLQTAGVAGVHDLRTRKMGDMLLVDVHLEVDAALSVEAGHNIAVEARRQVLQRHRVLNVMTHVDPWRRPDLDHVPTR